MTRKNKEMTLTEKLAQTIVEEYHPTSFKEVTDIVKSIYAPVLEQMLRESWMHTLVIRLNHTQKKQAITAAMAIQRKTLRLLRGRWKSRFPVTVKDPFSLRLSQKRPGISQRSKTRFWQCMQKGCPSGISPTLLRISMALVFPLKRSLRLQTGSIRLLMNGETAH